ncbi:MAG: glycosyltransferase family 4 protein [candidate division Zixibacteria bacterium]|nr:glycosyltransferase family 4 protein [candidate division Zixibacteria bacterium]
MTGRKPHLVVVNDFAHVNGGTAMVALSSAIALAGRGYPVTVFAAVGPVMPELKQEGVDVVCLGGHEITANPNRLRAVFDGLWNRAAARRMREVLKRLDPADTIIHIHGWTKALTAAPIAAALNRRFSIVLTLHDYFAACPNGGFYDFPKGRICPLRAMSPSCLTCNCDKNSRAQKLWRVTRQMMQKRWGGIPGRIENVITVSGFSRDLMAPYLPGDARLYDVRNPIQATQEPPAVPGMNKPFAFVGRLSPEKGAILFAEAAAKARIPALFIGDGEQRQDVATRCPEGVITGWVAPEEVRRHLRSARALVLPSLCYETQGMTVLEAAACSLPAIVPDTCAAREAVNDGVTGLWFRGGDADDLAAKLTLLQDDNLVNRLGRAAYDRFWADPSTLERHILALETVYFQILAARTQ